MTKRVNKIPNHMQIQLTKGELYKESCIHEANLKLRGALDKQLVERRRKYEDERDLKLMEKELML